MEGVSPDAFSINEAIAGTSPVSVDGKVVATLAYRSNKRSMGHLFAQLIAEDGTIVAQFDREQAAGIAQVRFEVGWGKDIVITKSGQPYATMSSNPSGSFKRTDGTGGLDFEKVGFCGQPACKYCCIAAVCCVPTLSIATVIALSLIHI